MANSSSGNTGAAQIPQSKRWVWLLGICLLVAGIFLWRTRPDSPTDISNPVVEVNMKQDPSAKPEPTEEPPLSPTETGTFQGIVKFEGTPPELSPLITTSEIKKEDREICSADEIPNESLVINRQGGMGIQNVMIYLIKRPVGIPIEPPPTTRVELQQKGCRWIPHVLAVRCDQPLLVKAIDPIYHDTQFNMLRNYQVPLLKPQGDYTETFSKPETSPCRIRCALHSWMSAHLLVVDHPFFSVTDENGRFQIDSLPAGQHKFRVWHEASGYLEKELLVEIHGNQTTEKTLTYLIEDFRLLETRNQ